MSDPHDPGGVTGSHERTGRGSTSARVGATGSPVGSPLTIVLALIAVAVGFLIFRSISDDTNGGALGNLPDGNTTLPGDTVVGQTTVAGNGAAPTGAPTTAAMVRDGATVVVANASDTGGVAGAMTASLEELGYTMGEPTDQVEGDENLATSVVYYAVGNDTQAVAETLALDMGGLEVAAMPDPVPAVSLGTGTVLLMLGNDLAGEEPPGPPPAAPAAPAAGATTTTTG